MMSEICQMLFMGILAISLGEGRSWETHVKLSKTGSDSLSQLKAVTWLAPTSKQKLGKII